MHRRGQESARLKQQLKLQPVWLVLARFGPFGLYSSGWVHWLLESLLHHLARPKSPPTSLWCVGSSCNSLLLIAFKQNQAITVSPIKTFSLSVMRDYTRSDEATSYQMPTRGSLSVSLLRIRFLRYTFMPWMLTVSANWKEHLLGAIITL